MTNNSQEGTGSAEVGWGTDLRVPRLFEIRQSVLQPYRDVVDVFEVAALDALRTASVEAVDRIGQAARTLPVPSGFDPSVRVELLARVPLVFPAAGFTMPLSWVASGPGQPLTDVIATVRIVPSRYRAGRSELHLSADQLPDGEDMTLADRRATIELLRLGLGTFVGSLVRQIDDAGSG